MIVPLYSALVRPYVEFCSILFTRKTLRDISLDPEKVKGTGEGSGAPALQVMAEGAGLYSLEKKREDLTALYNYQKEGCS